MDVRTRTATAASLAALLLLAGCLSVGGPGGSTQPTSTTIQQSGTPTPVRDGCPSGLAFYGLGNPGDFGWSTNEVAVGYTLPADSTALLVVLEDETVLGTVQVSNTNSDYAVAADGDTVLLDEPLAGSHEIRVVAYADSDGDGEFDASTDAPCHGDDGTLVTTGSETVDFDDLAS
jgi:hypothetical protein